MENMPSRQQNPEEQTEAIILTEQKRADRAEETIERMDHKDRLYSHVGAVALGSAEDTDDSPRPRTVVERIVDRRLEKKAYKRQYKQAEKDYYHSNLGHRNNRRDPVASTLDKLKRKRQEAKKYKSGEITATELRRNKSEIDIDPKMSRTAAHKKVSRADAFSQARLNLAVAQPVSSRWRSKRREWAHNKKVRAEEAILKHLQEQESDSSD